jgi:hypothetical protein
VYDRTAGDPGSGFVGTWDSDSAKANARIELQIQPDDGQGLTLKRSDEEGAKKIKFDGNDRPDPDPNGAETGSTYSARRVNERSLEITDKSKGKIAGTRKIELSSDLKTLTITTHPVGQEKPQSIFVYDRE